MRQLGKNSTNISAGSNIRVLTYSAVFLAVGLVFKTFFSFYIPLFGEHGMKIGVSGVFTAMPSILFGPVYGGIVAALSDFLGYLLNPVGAYLPLMTLVMALGGFINGFVWRLLKTRDNRHLRIALIIAISVAFIFGLSNAISLRADGVDSSFYEHVLPDESTIAQMRTISKLLITRTASTSNPSANLATFINITTFGPMSITAFGLILMLADILLSKKLAANGRDLNVLRILITLLVSGIVVSTLNTIILRNMLFESWKTLPFAAIWLPRIIEAILTNAINTYFVALLYNIFIKNLKQRNDGL